MSGRLRSGRARALVFGLVAVAIFAGGVPALGRSAQGPAVRIPVTPTLERSLLEGINDVPVLTPAQLRKVASDVRWLHDRLNVTLPRIKWVDGAVRTDGRFDSQTTEAVIFFKKWANESRRLLGYPILFKRIDGVVGQVTVNVLAYVAAYFQLNPAPPTPPTTTPPTSPPTTAPPTTAPPSVTIKGTFLAGASEPLTNAPKVTTCPALGQAFFRLTVVSGSARVSAALLKPKVEQDTTVNGVRTLRCSFQYEVQTRPSRLGYSVVAAGIDGQAILTKSVPAVAAGTVVMPTLNITLGCNPDCRVTNTNA